MLSETTHTLEMAQVAALNKHLTSTRHAPVTAGRLDIGPLPEKAVLQRVTISGPPSFPYVLGHFSEGTAELHTQALIRLSDVWHLHQHWGL